MCIVCVVCRSVIEGMLVVVFVTALPCSLPLPGQGHLSRCLAFEHGLDVVSVEAVGCHQERAARFAQQVAFGMRKEALKATASEQDSLPSGSQEDRLLLKCGRLQQVTAVVGH